MNELDKIWAEMLAKAAENAKISGKGDVADYINLKAANDLFRSTAVKWLFDAMYEISGEAVRAGFAVTIEKTEPHSFRYHGGNMIGSSVDFRCGVRCLTLEAGWTRTPSDGFMRGGALAFARFRHRGIPKANEDAALVRNTELPAWQRVVENKFEGHIGLNELAVHMMILTEFRMK